MSDLVAEVIGLAAAVLPKLLAEHGNDVPGALRSFAEFYEARRTETMKDRRGEIAKGRAEVDAFLASRRLGG